MCHANFIKQLHLALDEKWRPYYLIEKFANLTKLQAVISVQPAHNMHNPYFLRYIPYCLCILLILSHFPLLSLIDSMLKEFFKCLQALVLLTGKFVSFYIKAICIALLELQLARKSKFVVQITQTLYDEVHLLFY